MSFLMFHSGNIPIIEEDDMKITRVPLPTNDIGGWISTAMSSSALAKIYTDAKTDQLDAIMIVDSPDYGGQHEQRAISTGFRIMSNRVEFDFLWAISTEDGPGVGRGFVNDDQTQGIYRVTITSAGVLSYGYTSLE